MKHYIEKMAEGIRLTSPVSGVSRGQITVDGIIEEIRIDQTSLSAPGHPTTWNVRLNGVQQFSGGGRPVIAVGDHFVLVTGLSIATVAGDIFQLDLDNANGNTLFGPGIITLQVEDGIGADIAADIHAASSKTTPVDADEIGGTDSAASFALKKFTWANIKATFKTYYDSAISTLTNKTISGSSNTISGIDETMLSTSDITTLNATTSKHGFLKKLDNVVAHFMDGTGNWSVPAGGTTYTADETTLHLATAQFQVKSGGVGTTELANDAVTYAKMQNVSATAKVLGRKTAGAGDTEELSLSDVLDLIGSATQGDILYRGSSNWARLPAGTSGQFLETLGAGANPTWATAGGGGGASLGLVIATSMRAYTT